MDANDKRVAKRAFGIWAAIVLFILGAGTFSNLSQEGDSGTVQRSPTRTAVSTPATPRVSSSAVPVVTPPPPSSIAVQTTAAFVPSTERIVGALCNNGQITIVYGPSACDEAGGVERQLTLLEALTEFPHLLTQTATYAPSVQSPSSNGVRIGAICRDGWRSSSTGSGTCSWHGGVSRWIYS